MRASSSRTLSRVCRRRRRRRRRRRLQAAHAAMAAPQEQPPPQRRFNDVFSSLPTTVFEEMSLLAAKVGCAC